MNDTSFAINDIVTIILDVINQLCSNLFSSIDEKIFPLIDELLFINKNIFSTGDKMNKILSSSPDKGILLLANCLFTGFILYYAARLLIARLTLSEFESPFKFFMRAFLSGIAMNSSIYICKILITSTDYISSFFCSLGEEIFGYQISFSNLISILNSSSNPDLNMLSIDGVLAGMLTISSLTLLISFSYRYILIQVLIILSPFSFLCLCTQSTESFFKSWSKSLFSLLLLQVVISIILLIPYALIRENNNTLFNEILLIGSIMALLKANQFVKEIIGGIGITSGFQSGIAGLRALISK